MIQIKNYNLIEYAHELPQTPEVFALDFETTSGNPKVEAFNPYLTAKIAGAAITWGGEAYYIPVRHRHGRNISAEDFRVWLATSLSKCKLWVNQGIKFDLHFASEELQSLPVQQVHCILQTAKLMDSNRGFGRGGYNLTDLARDYIGKDISPFELEVKMYLKAIKSKDYGDVPTDIMGPYACEDAITAWELYHWQVAHFPQEMLPLYNTEMQLLLTLFDVEKLGLHVDKSELMQQEFLRVHKLNKLEEEIHELSGTPIRPHTADDCFDLFCNRLGLPVMGYTKAGQPSFGYDQLSAYLQHPQVVDSPKNTRLVKAILEFRESWTLVNMFIRPYQMLCDKYDNLHPNYNPILVTGRLSCSKPNSQQLSLDARRLIHPLPGQAFLSADYSQIEFRIIVHYIQALDAIEAYLQDPDKDFHTWVAEMCEIPRGPAKTVNFGIGFGAGKKRLIAMLSSNPDLAQLVKSSIDTMIMEGKLLSEERIEKFGELLKLRAEGIYEKYHDTLPSLKTTLKRAERICKQRGYVYNLYGRRRHLTPDVAWLSFNALCQGTAADIGKEAMNRLAPRYNPQMKEWGIKIAAMVHDEILFMGPITIMQRPDVRKYISDIMEQPSVKISVPMRVAFGYSELNWAVAAKESEVDRTSYDLGLVEEDDAD